MGDEVCDSGGTGRREVIVREMRFWVTGRDGKLLRCPQMTFTCMQVYNVILLCLTWRLSLKTVNFTTGVWWFH